MFSDTLKKLRKFKNITQEELALIVGVERSTVGKWESKNIIPPAEMLASLSQLFEVSTDHLLYGFDKGKFSQIVNLVRFKRSIKEFSNDSGIDEHYLTRLCSDVVYEQPPVEIVEKIANSNQNDWLVDRESIYKAAGYISEPVYDGPTPTAEEAFHDSLKDSDLQTIAAHHDGEEWTEEELAEIERFKEFVRAKKLQK